MPWLSFRAPVQSRTEYLDSRRGTRDEFVAFGGLVKRNPDRHTLRQPHPVEGRIDVGKQGRAGAAITILDTGSNAFHPSTQRVVAAHQPHIHGIAEMDARQSTDKESSMTRHVEPYRYEIQHSDDADFVAYQRKSGDGVWQTISVWMIPEPAGQ